MRRKLAYILLASAVLFGCAATIGPTLIKMDTDISYGAGKDLYFRLSETGKTYGGIYEGGESHYLTGQPAVLDAVATEMEARLKSWDVNGTVNKEGENTIRVTIRAQGADETEYQYLERYLPFSGKHFTIGAGCDSTETQGKADTDFAGKEYVDNAMFANQTASIEYVNKIPVVVIPVNYAKQLDTLVTFCTNNTTKEDKEKNVSASNCYLVIWGNKQDGDNYSDATAQKGADANMAARLVFGENATNAWFTEKNTDNAKTRLQLIPNSEALTDSGYDSSKDGSGVKAAKYIQHMMNASDYKTIVNSTTGCEVSFAYAHKVEASVENLVSQGDWHQSVAFKTTLIATLISLAFAIGIVALYYRLGALAVFSNVAISVMGTLLLFVYFAAQFGVGALVGVTIGALVTGFGSIYYFAKLKEELYEGRTAKKAHQEAIRKALWPSIDAAMVAIIIGVCIYGLVPSVVGKAGLAMVLGGFFGLVSNVLLLRLEGWLLANDNETQEKLGSVYGVEESHLVDAMKEEKQTYFGRYADHDFQKGSKVLMGVAGALTLASIVGCAVFTGIKGDAFNYANTYSDTSVIALEYKYNSSLSDDSIINTADKVKDVFLSNYHLTYNGKDTTLDALVSQDITNETSSSYDSENDLTYTIRYFHVTLDSYLSTSTDYNVYLVFNSQTFNYGTLSAAMDAVGDDFSTGVSASLNEVSVQAGTPSLGNVYIGLSVSLASLLLYFVARYKLSRGITATLIAGASGAIVAGFFALSRITVTPLVSLGVIATTAIAYVLAVFILEKEHEIEKESRERDKTSLDFKSTCLKKANGQAAGDLFIYAFIVSICFLVFGGIINTTWSLIYLGALLGFIVAFVMVLCLLTPISVYLAKLFSKIHLSFHPLKKETPTTYDNGPRKKGAEPEEAIFIGIND